MSLLNQLKSKFPKEFEFDLLYELVSPEEWTNDTPNACLLALNRSKIFDKEAYLKRYPDVQESNIDPIKHYLQYGINENRILYLKKIDKANKKCNPYKLQHNKNIYHNVGLVDVIIPIHNALSYFKECINSVLKFSENINKIILVNDNSDAETAAYLNKMRNKNNNIISLINNSINIGYTKSVNIGIKESKSKFLLLLNSDTIVTAKWLENLLKCINSSDDIGIVGPLSNAALYQSVPKFYSTDDGYFTNKIPEGLTIEDISEVIGKRQNTIYPRVNIINGFCFLFKREVLEKIGSFDEVNFPIGYGEEDDFCIRASKSNIKLAIADNVYIYHNKSKSFGKKRALDLAREGINKLYKKYGKEFIDKYFDSCRNNNLLKNIREEIDLKIKIKIEEKYKCTPYVSVIVPIYNNFNFLQECIQSIQNQTLNKIEILLVNDGSTDSRVMPLLKLLANNDKRIKIINKKNSGYGSTMNLGISIAKGLFIGIVDSDDYIHPTMYEKLYNKAIEYSLDIVKGDIETFIESDGKRIFNNCNITSKMYYNKILNPKRNLSCFLEPLSVSSCAGIINRNFININNIRYNETPGAAYQDTGFWFQCILFCESIYFINKPFYKYRMDNAVSSSSNKNMILQSINEFKFIKKIITNNYPYSKFIIPLYSRKKIGSLMYNYDKQEKKQNYLEIIHEEFNLDDKENLLSTALFTEYQSNQLVQILPCRYKISIIIPVYNSSTYLQKCIDSIKHQTLDKIEVIFIDDGSTDNSVRIIKNYLSDNIKLLQQKHSGSGQARNLGLQNAQGEFISFLDSDDFYPDNNSLFILYNNAIKFKCNISGGNLVYINNGKILENNDQDKIIFNNTRVIKYFDWQYDFGYTLFIYNKSFLKSNHINFPNYLRYQDPIFFTRAMFAAKEFCVTPVNAYCYRISQRKKPWNEEQINDLARGISNNLVFAKENNLKILFYTCIYRFLSYISLIKNNSTIYDFLNNIDLKYVNDIDKPSVTEMISKILSHIK